MGIPELVANWTLVYTAELLSFSLVLSFLLKSQLRRPILIWIISNLMAAVSMLTPSTLVETSSTAGLSLTSAALSILSTILPYFAVNYRQRSSSLRTMIFALCLATFVVSAVMPYGWLPLVVSYAAGAILVAICAWAAYKNPLWRGLWGHYPLVASFVACAALILWRGIVILAHRSGDGFSIDVSDTLLGMRMLVFVSFMLQISFISVVIGKDLRRRRIKDRYAARQFEASRAIAEEQAAMQALADERLDMISLLTHEVRQPINNAQAALEALDHEMTVTDTASSDNRMAISRAQSVLDEITLSISNAIIGVSLIEDDHSIQTSPMDATEIAEMARSDCPAEQRHRIHIRQSETKIFVDLDPLLARLALRNLFDNALKYSAPNSLIQLEIVHDEQRLGVSFLVTNRITDATWLSEKIFHRRVRGNTARADGSGHGLFLVKKVAEAHHGSITFSVKEGLDVTFDLFIPD